MGSMTKDVRKFIYDRLVETAAPPVLEEIMAAFALDRRQAREVVAGIAEAKQVVLLAGTDRILMAHPFSAVATPFRVTRGDGIRSSRPTQPFLRRAFHRWCLQGS